MADKDKPTEGDGNVLKNINFFGDSPAKPVSGATDPEATPSALDQINFFGDTAPVLPEEEPVQKRMHYIPSESDESGLDSTFGASLATRTKAPSDPQIPLRNLRPVDRVQPITDLEKEIHLLQAEVDTEKANKHIIDIAYDKATGGLMYIAKPAINMAMIVGDLLSRVNYAIAGSTDEALNLYKEEGILDDDSIKTLFTAPVQTRVLEATRIVVKAAQADPGKLVRIAAERQLNRAKKEILSGIGDIQGEKEGFGKVMEDAGVPAGPSFSQSIGFLKPLIYSETGTGSFGDNIVKYGFLPGMYAGFLQKMQLQEGGPLDPSVRDAVGLALDIGADPLTYVTIGTTGGARIITSSGSKLLTKTGVQRLSKIVNGAIDFTDHGALRIKGGADDIGMKSLRQEFEKLSIEEKTALVQALTGETTDSFQFFSIGARNTGIPTQIAPDFANNVIKAVRSNADNVLAEAIAKGEKGLIGETTLKWMGHEIPGSARAIAASANASAVVYHGLKATPVIGVALEKATLGFTRAAESIRPIFHRLRFKDDLWETMFKRHADEVAFRHAQTIKEVTEKFALTGDEALDASEVGLKNREVFLELADFALSNKAGYPGGQSVGDMLAGAPRYDALSQNQKKALEFFVTKINERRDVLSRLMGKGYISRIGARFLQAKYGITSTASLDQMLDFRRALNSQEAKDIFDGGILPFYGLQYEIDNGIERIVKSDIREQGLDLSGHGLVYRFNDADTAVEAVINRMILDNSGMVDADIKALLNWVAKNPSGRIGVPNRQLYEKILKYSKESPGVRELHRIQSPARLLIEEVAEMDNIIEFERLKRDAAENFGLVVDPADGNVRKVLDHKSLRETRKKLERAERDLTKSQERLGKARDAFTEETNKITSATSAIETLKEEVAELEKNVGLGFHSSTDAQRLMKQKKADMKRLQDIIDKSNSDVMPKLKEKYFAEIDNDMKLQKTVVEHRSEMERIRLSVEEHGVDPVAVFRASVPLIRDEKRLAGIAAKVKGVREEVVGSVTDNAEAVLRATKNPIERKEFVRQMIMSSDTPDEAMEMLFRAALYDAVPALEGSGKVFRWGLSETVVVKVNNTHFHLPPSLAKDLEQAPIEFLRHPFMKGGGPVQIMSRAMSEFKTWMTTLFPEYHIRNAYSNVFWNWMAHGINFWRNHFTAGSIVRGTNPKGKFITEAGEYSYAYLKDVMERRGITRPIGLAGEVIAERTALTRDEALLRLVDEPNGWSPRLKRGARSLGRNLGRGVRVTSTVLFGTIPSERLATMGAGAVENMERASIFLNALRRGESIDDAVRTTNRFLVDYDNLSKTERAAKYFIPFITWTRRMLPTAVAQIWENPGKLAAIHKTLHTKNGEEQYLPTWEMGNGSRIRLGSDPDGNIVVVDGVETPLTFFRLFDRVMEGAVHGSGITGKVSEMGKGALVTLTQDLSGPFVKLPLLITKDADGNISPQSERKAAQFLGKMIAVMDGIPALSSVGNYLRKELDVRYDHDKGQYTADVKLYENLFSAFILNRALFKSEKLMEEALANPQYGNVVLAYLNEMITNPRSWGFNAKTLDPSSLGPERHNQLIEIRQKLYAELVRQGKYKAFTIYREANTTEKETDVK